MIMYRFETPKDVSRFIRSIIELLILLALLFVVLKALLVFAIYEPYNKEDKSIVSGNDNGFLALSYIGVDREGTETLISTQKLDCPIFIISHGHIPICSVISYNTILGNNV